MTNKQGKIKGFTFQRTKEDGIPFINTKPRL